ncbi:hypothetical protein ACHAXT_001979 [Thalassiosira profunda]
MSAEGDAPVPRASPGKGGEAAKGGDGSEDAGDNAALFGEPPHKKDDEEEESDGTVVELDMGKLAIDDSAGYALLDDEALFKDAPPQDDCPICFLPLPLHPLSEAKYQACCGKVLCQGCLHTLEGSEKTSLFERMLDMEGSETSLFQPCPFCRTNPPKSGYHYVGWLEKRAEGNDTMALHLLGDVYATEGTFDFVPKDPQRAMKLWQRGADLDCIWCHNALGDAYYLGQGVEKNLGKAVYHFQLSAVGGCVESRINLGGFEMNMGNGRRALMHWMIAARAGSDAALKNVRLGFMGGIVSKDEFAGCLRAHKDSRDAMKSPERERALTDMCILEHLSEES